MTEENIAEEKLGTEAAADGQIGFEDLGLNEETLKAVKAKGFEVPSPIQILAIPRLLEGDANMIAKARTGTGKTAAFGLPLVQKITNDEGYPQALILTPTRELAMQVCREIESFTNGRFPRLCAVYGGAGMASQLKELKRGVDIVVGTPGRVMDHLERGTLRLDKIKYFILDEADEMLDMGFIEDIEHIFGEANPESRILLFSATMPAPILKIAAEFMGDYEIIEEEAKPEEPILTEQHYWLVREYEKIEALVRLIDLSPDFYGLVFTQTKSDADMVAKQLDERGYEAAALHGDIPQSQREKILARFRAKKTRILVATDVAARGIDIEGLTHVVNYALPYDGPTYVHRIGRTGRAGAKGLAYTLVRPEERRKIEFIKNFAKKATKGDLKEEEIPSVESVLDVKRTRLFSEMKDKLGLQDEKTEEAVPADAAVQTENADVAAAEASGTDAAASDAVPAEGAEAAPAEKSRRKYRVHKEFLTLADELCEETDPQEVLARVLQMHFGRQLDPARYGSITPLKVFNQGKQIRLYVQLGRRDGFNAREIASYFSNLLHIPQRMVDRIEVTDAFSLVSLPIQAGKDVLDRSKRDKSLPHMHIDSKESSGGFGSSGGKGGRSKGGFGEKKGGRSFSDDFKGGSKDFGHSRRDFAGRRGGDFSKDAKGRRDRSYKSGFSGSRRSGSGIPRRSEEKTGNASLYKKQGDY